jgi:hypothetical protein
MALGIFAECKTCSVVGNGSVASLRADGAVRAVRGNVPDSDRLNRKGTEFGVFSGLSVAIRGF